MTVDEIIDVVSGWGSVVSGEFDSSRAENEASQEEIRRVVDAIRLLAKERDDAIAVAYFRRLHGLDAGEGERT